MGKQKPKYNFTLSDALGDLNLSGDAAVKQVETDQALRASKDTLSSQSVTAPTFQFLQYDKDVYDSYLKPGEHYGSPEQLDYQVGENQSVLRQTINGLGRLMPLVATKLANQVVATKQAVEFAMGNKDVFDDDEVVNQIKGWEEEIKTAMPIYATSQYDNGSLLEQMGTAKFWADDLGDGVAFLGAQFLGTKGVAAGLNVVGRGAGLLAKAAPTGAALLESVPGAAKVANAIANNYTAVGAGIVNAGFSGAIQAQDTSAQIKERLAGKVNPKTGMEYTEGEIKDIAGTHAANTFNSTFLVHILPGIWESKVFLGLNKAKLGDLQQSIIASVNRGEISLSELLAGTGEGLKRSMKSSVLKGVAKGAAIEGLWEENIEQSIQNYDIKQGLNDQNTGVADRTLNYAMGMISNFGTKDDAKAIMLGALLGGPMGGFHAAGNTRQYNERIPGYLNSLRASDQLYQEDINSIYKVQDADVTDSEGNVTAKKGSLILDENGEPVQDIEKLKKLTFQILSNKSLWDKQTVATLTGNKDMASMNENMAMSASIFRQLATDAAEGNTDGDLTFLKWKMRKQLEEQAQTEEKKEILDSSTVAAASTATEEGPAGDIEAEQAASKAKAEDSMDNGKSRADLSKVINDTMSKIDLFAAAYKRAQSQSQKLSKLGQDPERTDFNYVAQKGLYYEDIKRASLDEMVEDRKRQLSDPLADQEKIAKEIDAITALKEDSYNKSKAYLNNTDEIFREYAGPREQFKEIATSYNEQVNKLQDTTMSPEDRSAMERSKDTQLYRMREMDANEGLGDLSSPMFNQELISTPISQRGTKPIGTRNEFFWNAGNDFSKMNELNNKIDQYEEGKATIKDVISYAKESISHIDDETSKRLNELLTKEREILTAIEDKISTTDADIFTEAEDGETDLTPNQDYIDLVNQRNEIQANINEATQLLQEKEKASELNMINNQPQNVEKYLIKNFAERHFDKGNYVLRNALDPNGEIKEDYFDRDTVQRAITDLLQMRNAIEDRLTNGDLVGQKGFSYLISDADKMLEKLYAIREQAELNKNNREGKQADLNLKEARMLMNAIGSTDGVIHNSAMFDIVNSVLNNNLTQMLADINNLTSNHYESTMALLHQVQSKATPGQIGQMNAQMDTVRNSSKVAVGELLPNRKGSTGIIVRDFAKNPRQMFPAAWMNLSHLNGPNGYIRVDNAKGSLFNLFNKNNDIDEIIYKAEAMPEDTKELGMPKADFMKLAVAYKNATSAQKLQNALSSPIKPIVESELKLAPDEQLAPTAQQDISIREGISWLNRNISSNRNKPAKVGLDSIYTESAALAAVGTKEQYSNYINSIFPNSKVPEIMYHNSQNKFDINGFDSSRTMYFTSGDGYHFEKTPYTVKALVNIKAPALVTRSEIQQKTEKVNVRQYIDQGKDGMIADTEEYRQMLVDDNINPDDHKQALLFPEIVVFDKSQIHELGSKEDIAGFKKFVNEPGQAVKTSAPFSGWSFLKGIAGTGKTNVVLKWILNNSGIDKGTVMATSLTQTATDVLSQSTGVQSAVFNDVEQNGVPEGIKLLIIDEYGTIGAHRLSLFEETLRGRGIKVLMLGDPTQITPRLQNNEDINNPAYNPNAANIEIINPVTVVYRSDISAVNEASDLFQDNNQPVGPITVRADRALGQPLAKGVHTSSSAVQIRELIAANIAAENEQRIPKRSRAIIVGNQNDIEKYSDIDADVMTVYDAQSRTYDEVYTDLQQKDFVDVERYNTAMYTAASRAKQYSFITYNEGTNILDESVGTEFVNNQDKLKASKTAFIQAKTEELAMMNGLERGQTIRQTTTNKDVQADIENAGKSELDIESEESRTDDVPIVVAETPSNSDDSDEPIEGDPIGPVDPDTEGPTEPDNSLPVAEGTREGVDNVDAEAYPALKNKLIDLGSRVVYIYNKEPNGENAVSTFAQTTEGNWVRIGKIFQEQINNDPRFADIKAKVGNIKPFHTPETDVLNGRGSGNIPYTEEQLAPFTVRQGRISAKQYLRFIYQGALKGTKTLAKDLGQIFKEKFFYKSQAQRADQVRFKIFTDTDLTKGGYDGTFRPVPGIPYAIIGSDGITYKNAMFVRLQANPLNTTDDQIVTLRKLANAVEQVQNKTGILMGTKGFSDLIRVFRNSLEIVQEQTVVGTVPKVQIRSDYSLEEMIANAEEMFEKDKRNGEPNLLQSVPDDQLQDTIRIVQEAAMQMYGIKSREGKYTQAEIAAMGEEYEAVPMNVKQQKNGEDLFYANLKADNNKRSYKRELRLDVDNGVAQIAFDQIARANEFVGNTRIRVQRHLGKQSERKPSYKGKSLINAEGGSARVYEMMTLLASNVTIPKMIASGKLIEGKEHTSSNLKAALDVIRGQIDTAGQDPLLYMQNALRDLGDDAIDRQAESILNKKETPPVNLNTLKLIAGEQNFTGDGSHLTAERYKVTDSKGQTENKQTFLRKPLQLDKFNDLGKDPIKNADELAKMVHTMFDNLSPTKIEVDYDSNVETGESSAGDVPSPIPNKEDTNTEHHSEIDRQIAELTEQIAATTDPRERIRLRKQLVALENNRGRMPYDSAADRPAPGKRIDMNQALADLTRMLPSINPSDIVFATRAMMSQLAKPGEDLLGLFDKGKIYLDATEDGSVYDKVLRHEVMHKIYNEFLTDAEKIGLRLELDPAGTMNSTEFDEMLADKFMEWQIPNAPETFSQRVRSIFQKILNWLGFYNSNKSAMKTVFQNVEDGKYSNHAGGTSDVRRAFSNIKADFGNVANYKEAVKAVHGMVRDSVLLNDLTSSPITMKEAKEFTKQKLMAKKVNLSAQLAGLREDITFLSEEDGDLFTQTSNEISDLAAQLSTLGAMFPGTSDKVFNQLWKDMYPNYNFKEGERINSFEEEDGITELDDLTEEQLQADTSATSMQDFTVQSDERNNEGKVTENVKNFLSFIFRPSGVRVNPRYAYLECLRTLNGLVSGEANLKEQIRESAVSNGIDLNGKSDGRLVVDHLLNLIDQATADGMTDINKIRVELPRNARFFDEDTFYKVQSDTDISGISKDEITGEPIKRNQGESTPAFINRISTNYGGLDKAVVRGYFKQAQAQETMREVMSNFLSQREADPMIAEEARIGAMGNTSTILRYFRAQMHGAERIMATDVENAIKTNWLKIPGEVWTKFNEAKDSNDKVGIILKALGINKDTKEMNKTLTADIAANMSAFNNVITAAYKDGKPQALGTTGDMDVEGEQENIQLMDVEFLLGNETSMINNITKMLSRNSADARPAKYQSTDGRSRYSFHNSNQAIETMQRVIDATGKNAKKVAGLPAHLRTAWAKLNPFVEGKINQIHRIIDHDGMRKEWGEEFAKGYTDESNADNLARQFSYGFLSYLKTNATKSDENLKYIQFFYTISNRPRMVGAEVNVLRSSELNQAAHKMLDQLLTQPEDSSIKNYSRYKTINADALRAAIVSVAGEPSAEVYDKISKSANMKQAIVEKFRSNLHDIAQDVAKKMVSERMILGDDASKVATLMKEGRRKYMDASETTVGPIQQTRENLGYTEESILPLVEQWVANNYINGYFMNQLPVGNFNYFKSAIDLVKRMSGVFAPGTKGLVDADGRFFMKPKFRMAIMNDPKMYSYELSEVFRDNDTALYQDAKNDLGKKNLLGIQKENGFELADAQGFMLPSRAANIVAGMGQAYNAGAIFKPAYYEVVDRQEAGFVPVMIKYSSAILSDDLVAKFPKLARMRQSMIDNNIDELVFDSANKVGGPVSSRPVPELNDFTAADFVIPESAVVALSNENYRLQLNPKHDTFSNVSNPTQLGYFLNVMGKVDPKAGTVNDAAATEVYTAIGNLISHGLKKVNAGLTSSGKVDKRQVQKTLTGAGNERIAEMLKDLSYNMPNIADKALIQIMNMFSKETVKIKFKGGKFVLQAAYGFEMIKPGSPRFDALTPAQQKAHNDNWSRYGQEEREKIVGEARNLKYGTDEKGRMFAEVLIDENYANKARIGDFLLPDMMGYRIPSTELHSSVAIKVAGFYDSKGSNVIVAPPELVKQHGSDFDVDSLYVIGRENYEKDVPELNFKAGTPVGYDLDKGINKYVFNKDNWEKQMFPKWYRKAGNNKQLIGQIDKLYEMFQRNVIVENFLNVISHPVNIQRMTEPISVQVIKDTLSELKLDTEVNIDLSNPLNNLDVYNSNFQGAKLVGVFANGMKALAYMLKAGSVNPVLKNGVEKLFADNSELAKVGTPEQYSQYIGTVFPESKVQDIVYHGTGNDFEVFERGHKNKDGHKANTVGFHFIEETGAKDYEDTYGSLKSAVLNMKNPLVTEYDERLEFLKDEDITTFNKEGIDSGVITKDGPGWSEYIAFDPNQIHVLGTKKDIQAFRNFVKSNVETGYNYPTLQNPESGVTVGKTTYNTFQEKLPDGKTIWQTLDALVNTSVDNVKEQQLYKINATNSTGNMYVAAQAMGIPLTDTVTFMLQPIGLLHSKFGGKLEMVKAELVNQYNRTAEVKVEGYPELAALASTIKAPGIHTMRGFINMELSTAEGNDVLKQVSMMKSFENLYILGQDISTFSSAVGIVQDLPVLYPDIQKKADNWEKLGSVDKDGNFVTNPDFSFNLDNLFTSQPNIKEAYKVFTSAKQTAEISLTKHLPAMRAFVDEVIDESGVRLSFKQNVEDVKNEVVSYLISSMYSDENKAEAPYSYMYKGAPRILTGKQAWSQRFIEEVEAAKKASKADQAGNSFLNKIGIQTRYGTKTLTFAISSNSDYMDSLEMQEAFEQLPGEKMKEDFVKYAVMNYGLRFGVKNYSMFIPASYLKPVDEHMKNLDRAIRNNKLDENGKVYEGELKNIKDNFMLRLAVNNADKLPFISSRKMKPVPTEGKFVTVQDPAMGPKQIPALSGFDEYFYNRKYANPIEDDTRKFKAKDFPQFIKTSENVVLMRVNSPDSDFVYYQRLGMKNWLGGYDASTEALKGNYELDKYFGKNLIPVPVGDVSAKSFDINNEYVQSGSRVIVYGYSNESRDQGRFGIVDEVRPDLTNPAKKTITIRDVEGEVLTGVQTQFLERFNPLVNMLRDRFKIPMNIVSEEQMPVKGVKGAIKDGVVYLNMDRMTWDTPFHEVAHPLIDAIRDKNPAWFQSLIKEFNGSERGKEIIEQVGRAYPELDQQSQQIEGLVTLLGELAAENLNTTPTLKSLALRLMRAIGDIWKSILTKAGVINMDQLSRDELSAITLEDISKMMAAKSANIELDLSGYIKLNRESKMLNDIEQRLFEEGRIILSCKA